MIFTVSLRIYAEEYLHEFTKKLIRRAFGVLYTYIHTYVSFKKMVIQGVGE